VSQNETITLLTTSDLARLCPIRLPFISSVPRPYSNKKGLGLMQRELDEAIALHENATAEEKAVHSQRMQALSAFGEHHRKQAEQGFGKALNTVFPAVAQEAFAAGKQTMEELPSGTAVERLVAGLRAASGVLWMASNAIVGSPPPETVHNPPPSSLVVPENV
jgi:hypothetical protein